MPKENACVMSMHSFLIWQTIIYEEGGYSIVWLERYKQFLVPMVFWRTNSGTSEVLLQVMTLLKRIIFWLFIKDWLLAHVTSQLVGIGELYRFCYIFLCGPCCLTLHNHTFPSHISCLCSWYAVMYSFPVLAITWFLSYIYTILLVNYYPCSITRHMLNWLILNQSVFQLVNAQFHVKLLYFAPQLFKNKQIKFTKQNNLVVTKSLLLRGRKQEYLA